jgi:hypothetical protein
MHNTIFDILGMNRFKFYKKVYTLPFSMHTPIT